MGSAYHSSGERDEETGEYRKPDKWDKNSSELWKTMLSVPEAEPEIVKTKQDLPKEFDEDYYIEKRDRYSRESYIRDSVDYWCWERYRTYANAVFNFYRAVASQFYATYAPDMELPGILDTKSQNDNIDELAVLLDDQERKLMSQFTKSNRTVRAKINKHTTLARLESYATKAWLMYHVCKGDIAIPVRNAIGFTRFYAQADRSDDIDMIRIYRGCQLLQRNFRLYIKSKFLFKQDHFLYTDVDARIPFNEILESINVINIQKNDEIQTEISPDIERLKEKDMKFRFLIDFYRAFDDMQHTLYEIDYITHKYRESPSEGISLYSLSSYGVGVDVFDRGLKYYKWCKIESSKYDDIDDLFANDIKKMIDRLYSSLTDAKDIYNHTHQMNVNIY